jgi:hypothetical protein
MDNEKPYESNSQPVSERLNVGYDLVSKRNEMPAQSSANSTNQLILMLKSFDEFAEYILNSEYRKQFEKVVLNADGKQIKIAEKGDIIACLALGHELGIPPMSSVALGKQLNAKSYFSVIKGKELGLNPVTSISKIYNIETSQGSILSLAVDIVVKVLHENGCQLDYVIDYKLVPIYRLVEAKIYVGHYYNIHDLNGDLNSEYFIYEKGNTKPDEVSKAVEDKKIIIQKIGYSHVTGLRVIRPKINFDKVFFYSLQDAIDAGLYNGFHSSNVDKDGKPIYTAGRSNWNNHPTTMLRNRVTSIAGRVAVADKLQGSYDHYEAMEILNVSKEEDLINAE